jgi:hypothetical protein
MRRISSGVKHTLIYEFISLQAGATYFVDTVDTGKWSRRAVENLVHAPPFPRHRSPPRGVPVLQ